MGKTISAANFMGFCNEIVETVRGAAGISWTFCVREKSHARNF